MAALPPELFALVASYAEVETMKNLRLSSRAISALTFRSFVSKALSQVNVGISKRGLQKLREICNCASIASHIRSIRISTEVPRRSAIHNLRKRLRSRSLREPPLADPTGALKQKVEALHVALCEYQSLCGSGELMDQLRAAFEGLRVHGNTGLTLVIHSGQEGPYECFNHPWEALEIGSQASRFTHILRHGRLFTNEHAIQMRILLALASSGIAIQRLRLSAEAGLAAFAWDDIHPFVEKDDIITPYNWFSHAPAFKLQKLHIKFAPQAESWERSGQISFHTNSALMRLIGHTEILDDLTLEGPFQLSRFDASGFLKRLPPKRWHVLRLRTLSMDLDTLKHFLEVNSSTLIQLDLDSVELVLPSGEVKQQDNLELTDALPEDSEWDDEARELWMLLCKGKRDKPLGEPHLRRPD